MSLERPAVPGTTGEARQTAIHAETVSPEGPRPRIVVFGIRCVFTDAAIGRLTAGGHPPVALILPGPPAIDAPIHLSHTTSSVPMVDQGTLFHGSHYPTYQIGRLRTSATVDLVRSLAPDLLVVACFPRLIPRAITEIARLAALNIHPSLLPRHRGPDPLFWIMREGGAGCGVTVHLLADRFDAGDILAQQAVSYPDGVAEAELERRLATLGADLTSSVIAELVAGAETRVLQDEHVATYESWPAESDYIVDRSWPVQRAYNFIRGVRDRSVPVRIAADDRIIHVIDALEYGDAAHTTELESGLESIQLADGWLVARLASQSRT